MKARMDNPDDFEPSFAPKIDKKSQKMVDAMQRK